MSIEIKITKEYSGISPKNFLKKKVDVPYQKLIKLIATKRITINDSKVKDGLKLEEGDVVKIWPENIKLRGENKPKKNMKNLDIKNIFENDDFLVLNKEPGVVVQGAQDHDTSLSLHLEYLKNKSNDTSDFDYTHVHRLDKDTSGVLVVAKKLTVLRDLHKIFRTREIVKKYVCLTVGKLPQKEGKIEEYLCRTPQGSREKVKVCNSNDKEAKKSLSYYKVLEEVEYENQTFSFVEVIIKTGITHQIRVHMKHLGCSILGDKMYGNSFANRMIEGVLDRQFLHAKSLEFNYNDQEYKFEAELSLDLENTLKKLKR